MPLHKLGNYKLFLLYSSIGAIGSGLFTPFWIVFIQQFGGGFERFGFAIGLSVLAQGVTAYVAGRHSDVLGRKPFLIGARAAMGLNTLAYTIISTPFQLYVLQILNGIIAATHSSVSIAFLGDITKKKSRGHGVGVQQAVLSETRWD